MNCQFFFSTFGDSSLSEVRGNLFSMCVKFYEKLKYLLTPLIRTRTYQEVRNVSFSENFAYVLNEWSLMYGNIFFWEYLPF